MRHDCTRGCQEVNNFRSTGNLTAEDTMSIGETHNTGKPMMMPIEIQAFFSFKKRLFSSSIGSDGIGKSCQSCEQICPRQRG